MGQAISCRPAPAIMLPMPTGASNVTNPNLIPAQAEWRNLGLNLRAAKGPWAVDLSASNLTNFDEPYTGGTSITTNGVLPRPRTLELQVTYDRFGSL
jgi:hypothetical protein